MTEGFRVLWVVDVERGNANSTSRWRQRGPAVGPTRPTRELKLRAGSDAPELALPTLARHRRPSPRGHPRHAERAGRHDRRQSSGDTPVDGSGARTAGGGDADAGTAAPGVLERAIATGSARGFRVATTQARRKEMESAARAARPVAANRVVRVTVAPRATDRALAVSLRDRRHRRCRPSEIA